jgi:hypothetical protein
MPKPKLLPPETESNVIKALATFDVQVAISAIVKCLPVGGRPSAADLRPLIDKLVADGRMLQTSSSPPKYIGAPIELWAQRAILASLAKGPQTEAKLKAKLTVPFEHALPLALKELVRAGRIFRHPPTSKAGKPAYANFPPDPAKFLSADLEKLISKVASLGFEVSEVKQSAIGLLSQSRQATGTFGSPQRNQEKSSLLERLCALDPRVRGGASVSIRNLRASMQDVFLTKADFDETLIALAREGVIEMQSHAWPARLTETERLLLVENDRGGWFDSVALRQPPTA